MGYGQTKEEKFEELMTMIKSGNSYQEIHDKLFNENCYDTVYVYSELKKFPRKLKFHKYFMMKEDCKMSMLFLAIVYKNYKLLERFSMNDKFRVVMNSSYRIHKIIDDKIFDILVKSVVNIEDKIQFCFKCKRIEVLKEIDIKHLQLSFHQLKIVYENDKNFAYKIARENPPDICSEESLIEYYELFGYFTEIKHNVIEDVLRNNSIEVAKKLIDKEIIKLPNHTLKKDLDLRNASVELFELLSSLENFDDFLYNNRHVLMKNVNDEVRDYLFCIRI